ncbi:hypothetical protein ACHAPT_013560 [Fusarium lateritium]
MTVQPVDLSPILDRLLRTENDSRPIVVMTCGIAGAGKSTLAKQIVNRFPNFIRLSGDEIVHKTHGLYTIDYPEEKYEDYLDEAQEILIAELKRRLEEKEKDIVLDLSFWNKQYRDDYKSIIEGNGGRWVLIFLDADRELLWKRITQRSAERDASDVTDRNGDSAFNIDQATFDMYCEGFERPRGEGECVIKVV